ncbi:MAG TPA: efflux RND transporter periplasmic adaptor subunit [Candidatus Macondimonas sp.]|nr:efflux RND transporter periplasmic adaptor subunit [Candidatus Macondimonas sp.]
MKRMRKLIPAIILAALAVLAVLLWPLLRPDGLPAGLASGNGRIEAVEIDVATKLPGRLATIAVREGDFVAAGDVLAEMDLSTLRAQEREALANLERAHVAVETARNQLRQREAERAAAAAVVRQRETERHAASLWLGRTQELAAAHVVSAQSLDDAVARFEGARAAVAAAAAQVAASEAAVSNAQAQINSAASAVRAVEATLERIRADLDDGVLRAPRAGRVQYRVAEPGEVLPAGGVVLNLVDLSDVYMTFFLPTAQAGRVALGAEARLVLDAVPHRVIPARVSFVADVAQFTPKTVETAEEREKLMFRIKARIDPELLQERLRQVKTGLPGMAYVQLDPQTPWPEALAVNVAP